VQQRRQAGSWRVVAALMSLCALAVTALAQAAGNFTIEATRTVFPDAEHIGAIAGEPPAAPVFRGGKLVGYVFSSREVVNATGFSGRPIDILVGLDLGGIITGARIIEQHEPILAIGVPEQALYDFVAQYRGRDVRDVARVGRSTGQVGTAIDAISGASVSSLVLNDAIFRSARAVARSRSLLEAGAPAAPEQRVGIDVEIYAKAAWEKLLADGAVARLRIDDAALARLAPQNPLPTSDPEALFIDLYTALVVPAGIGRNLLGDADYALMMQHLPAGGSAILIAANGRYSFKGTAFARDGVFDRIQIVQDQRTIRLRTDWHQRAEKLHAENAPNLRELGLFTLPPEAGFDPAMPWRLELLVTPSGSDAMASQVILTLPYRLPAVYTARERQIGTIPVAVPGSALGLEPAGEPLWQEIWRSQPVRIGILALMLVVLTGILFGQDAIAAHRRLHQSLRGTALVVTLVWLGWFAGAQLSVLNVLTFVSALLSGFRWEAFLLDPLMFVLWGFVALSLLFWGRGVFCGWLCPFGALQELTHMLAGRLRLPQFRVPFLLHERLWPIKYVAFVGLLALSLQGLELVLRFLEFEPFKAAIVLHFDYAWPYVLYALALLGIGLFVERFFCRYLCPLGAALALPVRLRTFEWLKRRPHCGTECQICATRCPVQAIHPDGQINAHECIYCLGCQVNFYDDHLCPPLIERRRRHDARAAARPVPAGGGAR
jgi:NosR/NirI family nitrous oxide reductase transcriptional regulator